MNRGTKAGVLCSLCSHIRFVGLSLRNYIRWRLRLGPSDSRFQREHSAVVRVSKGAGGATLRMILVVHEDQGENLFPMEIRSGKCRLF